MRRALLASVSILTAAVLAVSAPLAGPAASAVAPSDRESVTDRVGDAPVGIDLRSGTFGISREKAVFSVRIKGLSDRTFVAFEVVPLNSAWDRIAVYRENGRTVGKVYFVDNEEETTPYLRRCPGLQITWKPGVGKVRAVVPGRCLQASRPGYGPYVMRAFTRFGGVADSPGDTLPRVRLDY